MRVLAYTLTARFKFSSNRGFAQLLSRFFSTVYLAMVAFFRYRSKLLIGVAKHFYLLKLKNYMYRLRRICKDTKFGKKVPSPRFFGSSKFKSNAALRRLSTDMLPGGVVHTSRQLFMSTSLLRVYSLKWLGAKSSAWLKLVAPHSLVDFWSNVSFSIRGDFFSSNLLLPLPRDLQLRLV